MNKFSVLILMSLAGLAGCAHGTMRGTVAMKVSDNEAHVCLGEGEVKPGDKVALFQNVCSSPKASGRNGGGDSRSCIKTPVGEGEIERVLNEHYSVMKVSSGATFDEGTIVEKK